VTASEQTRLAAAYLSRVAEPACVPLWMLVERYGYVSAAAAVRCGEVPPEVRTATEARRTSTDAEADLEAADRCGVRLVLPEDGDWPHFALAAINAAGRRRVASWAVGMRARPERGELVPPLALWVKGAGDLAQVGVRSVAVVGSRAATAYGEHAAAEFGHGLAREGVVIVSGGAYGIDAAAHRGALDAGGCSVLVSAGGLDRPYPAGNRQLFARICEAGLLVSERPPGSAPHRQRFLSRNRIIASLGSALLLVEAARRSGALNSAGYARDLGRPVLAVPGPITSAMSVGCHEQIRRDDDPARLVTCVTDVLAYCGPGPGSGLAMSVVTAAEGPASGPGTAGEDTRRDALDPAGRAVLDGFPARRTVTEAELSRLSGRPIHEVIAALPALREAGLITAAREGYRLVGSRVAS
jgi:DNA processing protein